MTDENQQIKKIYNDILLLSRDSANKKRDVMALASYGKKAIPFIQESPMLLVMMLKGLEIEFKPR